MKSKDWQDYVQWEKALENLRAKRCHRLKIVHLASAHTGQARILQIYQRAVDRHPRDRTLRMESLNYTASIQASKRFRKAMSDALRMMPNDADLWIMAGQRSAGQGDMATARNFFLRGCEFCKQDERLWVEYARCEMDWLGKMEKKGKAALETKTDGEDELRLVGDDDDDEDDDGNLVPAPKEKAVAKEVAAELKSNPAMNGAIPIAIFDISRKQKFFNVDTAATFFKELTTYRNITVQPAISQHILTAMDEQYPNDAATCDCHVQAPIIGIDPATGDFPKNLRAVLGELKTQLAKTTDQDLLRQKTVAWIDRYLALETLDDGVRAVLEFTKKQQLAS